MVQFLSTIVFLGFIQFLLGFSKVPVFLCHSVLQERAKGNMIDPVSRVTYSNKHLGPRITLQRM